MSKRKKEKKRRQVVTLDGCEREDLGGILSQGEKSATNTKQKKRYQLEKIVKVKSNKGAMEFGTESR
jgi:hypothetical protein